MGLLISDTLLLDPRLDETLRWQDSFSEYACATDGTRESDEYESADPTR